MRKTKAVKGETLEQKGGQLMEKIDLDLQEIATEKQQRELAIFLVRFNKSNYKATLRERQLLGVMKHQLDWVLKNCVGE